MKEFNKPEDLERRVILILKILHESAEPLGARVIARRMLEQNMQLSERTVRYHLKIMDERGLTRLVGRRDGRMITDKGESEIYDARVQDKIGLSISRIDILSFKTTFDVKKKRGMVRSVDVARHMEVSKPSVCHAVATLRDGGFLMMDEDHFLHLTDVGREVAEKIYERHCFFTEQLIAAGVDPKTAEADACRIEHIISDESFSRLKEAAAQEQE